MLASAPRRPGESYRRIEVAAAVRQRLAIAAVATAVPIDVAATLICEAGLLLERLEQRRIGGALSLLDRAAAAGCATRSLGAADADYLRALGRRSWRRHGDALGVPVRVLERIGGAGEIEARMGHVELLEPAIRWEVGALLTGSRMGSWGCEAILAGFRPRSWPSR